MERGRPTTSDSWRAGRSNQAPTFVILPQAVSPSAGSTVRQSPTSYAVSGATPTASPVNWQVRQDGLDQLVESPGTARRALPDFSNGQAAGESIALSEDGPSVLSRQESCQVSVEGNGSIDAGSLAGRMPHREEGAGPMTLQQFQQLSEEQFKKMQRGFQEKVSQLHQVIDARLQGVATRRMLDDHATLGMLNQLSAACEERFKMLEADWSLHGQKLLRIQEHCSTQSELHSDLEQQVRRMTLSRQGNLSQLPSEEDLVGTLEAIQRDVDLLRSSQSIANGELMQHRAELLSLQGQSSQGASVVTQAAGSALQPSQSSCSSCGNVHLARAQFCRICGKKRDDRISGINSPMPGAPMAPSGLLEDLDARMRGLEANMSAALNQRRNEAAELAVQMESVQDHVRLLEAHLQSVNVDEIDRTPLLRDRHHTSVGLLDCSSEAQDQRSYATKHELMAVASGCKALEVSVDSQIVELRGKVEDISAGMKQDVAKLEVQVSMLRGRQPSSTASDGTSHWHPLRDD